MASPIRMTTTTRSVLDALQAAARQDSPTYGLEICRMTDLGAGTVYPILRRLERIGWVRTFWEEESPDARGPRRRMYELTGEGRAGIAEAQRSRQVRRLGWIT
ncbi:PadR family transcriptional regulator [Nonomuraea sp. LPB2021202275-12-8]|uniref:PadR family transcriptional regulator n=1 Tax=Nonomuraea sp. LPB2021202275-12-8 TaxID=3120159 RepID=UPI00300D38E3